MIKSALIISLVASPAAAQMRCGDREAVVERLAEEYGETRRIMAVTSNSLFEFYASDSGTWTILVSTGDGMACMVSAGRDWRAEPAGLPL